MEKLFTVIVLVIAVVLVGGIADEIASTLEGYRVADMAEFFMGSDELLRLHVRADSDTAFDQALKIKVKDRVCEYFVEKSTQFRSKTQAIEYISQNIEEITRLCEECLFSYNKNAIVSVSVEREHFPEMDYDGEIVSEGIYDAVIVTIGRGNGANWWCVAYPPLCFIGGQPNPDNPNEITYKSIIADWIYEIFGR